MAPMPSTNPLSLKKRALESDSSVENSSPFKKQRPLSDDNTLLRSYQNSTHEGSEQESSSDSSSDSDTMRTEPITLAERPRRRTSSEEDVVTDSGSDSGEESESSESSTSSSSSSSSSSEEDEDDAMSETEDNDQEDLPDAIPRIPALQKPQIQRPMDSDLRSRLTTFLPTLKAANEDLEGNIAAGKGGDIVMDNADEGKESQYIEMDLGLGVLEENPSEDSDSSSSSTSSTSDDEDRHHQDKHIETNVLGRLMGDKSKPKRNTAAAGIEEVNQK